MKLQTRILALGLVPAFLVGAVSLFLSTNKLVKTIESQAYEGMNATALAVREVFENCGEGDYQLVDGQMWKGESINMSESYEIVDGIKASTGFDVTVFYEDTRMLTTFVDGSGNRQVGTTASEAVTDAVYRRGETYQNDDVEIFGERYIVFYIPLYQTGTSTPVGMIFLGQKFSNVIQIISTAASALAGSMVLILAIALVIIIFNVRRITKPMMAAIGYLREMGDGKIGIEIDEKLIKQPDEVGDMCRQINSLDESLKDILTAIMEQVDVLNETYEACNVNTQQAMVSTDQIDDTVNGLSLANTSLADDALAAGDSVEIISKIIENTNVTMQEFSDTANSMESAAASAKNTLSELNDSMNEVMSAVDEVYGKTSETHESVSKIANMVNVISEIASQTNLLSLNASIEAARAGEMGKGFAVVAGEIQSLAEQSDSSAKEIQNVLDQLVENSNQSVETMDKMQTMIEAQKNKIHDTNEAFEGVSAGIEKTVSGIENIDEQMKTLSNARNNTSDTVQNVASIAQENAASAQETASNMSEIATQIQDITDQIKELGSVAATLNEKVKVFTLS